MKFFLLFFSLLLPSLSQANTPEPISFTKGNWEELQFSKLKPNTVSFNNQALTIKVNQSASPLIYPLKAPTLVKEITIDADIMGKLKLDPSKQQGSKGNDDFTLSIGLVYQGEKKLGFMKRQIAAPWVKKLYSLAPKNIGVSHVEFFSVYQDKRLANIKTKNSQSDLFLQNYSIAHTTNGKIKATLKVPENKKVLALWISSDGDDTKSSFAVRINKLALK